jgi:hypothetical protein
MGLGIKFKNASVSLPGAQVYAEDGVLKQPNGVELLLDTRSSLSWPLQGNPTTEQKYWINRAPNQTVPKLLLGKQAPPVTPTTDTFTPTFSDGGFLMQSAVPKVIKGGTADFAYTVTDFYASVTLKLNAAFFARTQNQGLIGRWAGVNDLGWYLLADVPNNFISALYKFGAGSGDYAGAGISLNAAVGDIVTLGLSWQKTGASTAAVKVFKNGLRGVNASLASSSLFAAPATSFSIGGSFDDNSIPANGILYRAYIHNLTVSGRTVEDVSLEDYIAANV